MINVTRILKILWVDDYPNLFYSFEDRIFRIPVVKKGRLFVLKVELFLTGYLTSILFQPVHCSVENVLKQGFEK